MLVPWSALSARHLFDRRLDPFGQAFDGFFPVFNRASTGAATNTGLEETDDAFVFTADLAGMDREQVSVTFEDEVLSIVGQRQFEVPDGYSASLRERQFDHFEKRFRFRTLVEPSQATADFTDGVLTVILPKAEQAKPTSIKIA